MPQPETPQPHPGQPDTGRPDTGRPDTGRAPRLTIKDIAARAGLSIGSVSYALNGRPGVSEATRERVVGLAAEMGWMPDPAARQLAGARADTVGLVLATQVARTLGLAPWFMEFISGVETALSDRGFGLLMRVMPDVTAEISLYRRWSATRQVDAVLLVDLVMNDPRIPALQQIGLTAVAVGPPQAAGALPSVWTHDDIAMKTAVQYLYDLGHRRIARVGGPTHLAHSRVREQAFDRASTQLGVESTNRQTDYSSDEVRAVLGQLLAEQPRPTAIIFDDDLGAVGALSVARAMGIDVPEDLSVLAWDDSYLCEISYPQLSAMSHDVCAYGASAARLLLDTLEGRNNCAADQTRQLTPRLRERASTIPPQPRH